MIVSPARGVYVSVADYSFYNFRQYSHTRQYDSAYKIRKVLDLSDIDSSVWKRIKAARVDVFMYTEDGKGDGFDDAFDIVVNGNASRFSTKGLVSSGWGWYGCQLPFNWFGFEIDRSYLTRGENEIVIGLAEDADNDDRLHVGIDMFDSWGRSFRSSDGGKSWHSRPLCLKNQFSGEYMVRLVLYVDKS